MDSSPFDSPQWSSAATLAERLPAPSSAPTETARQTLDLWRQQPPFEDDSLFQRRLALDGVGEDELLALLSETPESLQERLGARPAWLEMIEEAFSREDCLSGHPLPLPEKLRGAQTAGFLNVVAPLLRLGLSRLRREAERIRDQRADVPFDPDTVGAMLFAGLAWQMHSIFSRSLVLELNIARLEGRLPGETPQERFAAFVQWLEVPGNALALLREYPVLARRATNRIRKWVERSAELLQHLADDWQELRRSSLLPDDCGPVAEIETGAGDTHRDGRTVSVFRFASGAKVVYKPRSLRVDCHFQELLQWLNARMPDAQFRTIAVLDRDDYGWVEFVQAAPCASAEQVSRFYRRQGGFLALLYALGATDFHYENLIAAGEHPVLIDLESLFHPPARRTTDETPDLALVSHAMVHSVLRIGLLPRRSWADDEYAGADLSGLGGKAGQLSPDRVLRWAQAGTDEMRAERDRVPMPGSRNRPALNEDAIDPLDYLDELLEGFSAVYRGLLEHRDELLSEDGPLARFGDDSVRAIVRPTRFYALLLNESSHPDLARDGLDREQFLDRIWVGMEVAPFLLDVIPSERRDLFNDDIPFFTTTPRSRDVWDSVGARIPEFLQQSGWDAVKELLAGLSAEDLADQIWFIRASMATLVLESDKFRWPRFAVHDNGLLSSDELRARSLEQAKAVGDSLVNLALRSDGHLAWIGLTFSNRQWSLLPLGEDLYAGSPGVILTLAYLGRITGEAGYTETARVAFQTLRERLDRFGQYIQTIGAFHGWGALIYTFTHLGVLWDDPALLAAAEGFVEQLAPLIGKDEELDIIGGTAGALGVLLSLQRVRPSAATLDAAIQCGEHLLQTATAAGQGIGWLTKVGKETPVAGFSHGCSGIAWALGELWAVTGDERYEKAAIDAVTYERSQFLPAAGNWVRPEKGPEEQEDRMALSAAWCYGAPGIGLARLRLLRNFEHPVLREDLSTAVQTTLREGFGTNHSLCHGALGNLDFLIQADQALGDAPLTEQVARLKGAILDSMAGDGWLCGVPLGVESPSLLNGLAGICYGALRLAEPERVPSLLVLDPPP